MLSFCDIIDYQEYEYMTSIPTELRTELLANRGNKCEYCGSQGKLEVHHVDYELGNLKDNLLILCRKCHSRTHSVLYRKSNGIEGKKRWVVSIYLTREDMREIKVEAAKSEVSLSIHITNIIEGYIQHMVKDGQM